MNEAFKIKRLGQEDAATFQQLIHFFINVFEMEKQPVTAAAYLVQLLKTPSFFVYVITNGSEIVAGLTAYELSSYYNEGAEIYIYDIAVKSGFQRKGLGKQLITTLQEHCIKNNVQLIFVEAHADDENAVEFYHSIGGKAEQVVHFNYYIDIPK